jgi:large subunit ribosomal protein L11
MKKIKKIVRLNLKAGKATAGPPVGPILGQQGINIALFCKEYNAQTKDKEGSIIPVKIIIYDDKTYFFILKTPPTSFLIKEYAKITKGSSKPNKIIAGSLINDDIIQILNIKKNDFNTKEINKMLKIINGTRKNMGINLN